MKKDLYASYKENIEKLLKDGKRRGELNKSYRSFSGFSGIENLDKPKLELSGTNDMFLFESLKPLSDITGKKAKYHEKPGWHPDFQHLKENDLVEYHYITSMFIDIKNSVGLFKKYDPITIASITNIIQKAAIHTCWYFDGFVQRFHGDGMFIYFGGKKMTIEQSVINAINTASFFSYFIEHDLKEMFLNNGFENITTRVGIDTGYEEDVVWYLAGIKDCSEITTCSLHTSLSYKMQGNASKNGTMLGDNVKDNTSLSSDLFTIKRNHDGKEERYIFQIPEENFNYTQWVFNWKLYLQRHPQIVSDSDGSLYFNMPDNIPSNLNINFLKSHVEDYRPYYNER